MLQKCSLESGREYALYKIKRAKLCEICDVCALDFHRESFSTCQNFGDARVATGETDGPRCRCLAPLERTKSNVKLISIHSESDRIEIQLDIRGGGAFLRRAVGAAVHGRAGGRAGACVQGIRKEFGRYSEGIRIKKKVFG